MKPSEKFLILTLSQIMEEAMELLVIRKTEFLCNAVKHVLTAKFHNICDMYPIRDKIVKLIFETFACIPCEGDNYQSQASEFWMKKGLSVNPIWKGGDLESRLIAACLLIELGKEEQIKFYIPRKLLAKEFQIS